MTNYDTDTLNLIKGDTPKQKHENLKAMLQRVQDLQQAILRFQAHLEEMGGNYTQDELWKMVNLATVDRPYFPPVEYHDNWSGTTKTTEHE